MKESRKIFGGMSLIIPNDWLDVTGDLEDKEAPLTLAKQDSGKGALQFSPAFYQGGEVPNFTTEKLAELLHDFAFKKKLTKISNQSTVKGEIRTAAGNFEFGDDFLRIWYCSDGLNIVLITYVCCLDDFGEDEVNQCEDIVTSLSFKV